MTYSHIKPFYDDFETPSGFSMDPFAPNVEWMAGIERFVHFFFSLCSCCQSHLPCYLWYVPSQKAVVVAAICDAHSGCLVTQAQNCPTFGVVRSVLNRPIAKNKPQNICIHRYYVYSHIAFSFKLATNLINDINCKIPVEISRFTQKHKNIYAFVASTHIATIAEKMKRCRVIHLNVQIAHNHSSPWELAASVSHNIWCKIWLRISE